MGRAHDQRRDALRERTDQRQRQDDLIIEHLDLVQHVVNQVSVRYPRHVDRQDLWNAGACGLVEAARRYRPEMGVPFPRYAIARIRGAIVDSTRDRDWVARTVRRNVREMKETEDRLEDERGRPPLDEELAESLNISVRELRQRRAAAVTATLLHLDHRYEDEETLGAALQEEDVESIPEEALERRELLGTLRTAIRYLPAVQRDVIERYYLRGETLHEIAASMNVTEARVSQICTEAINAIRSWLAMLYEGVPEVAPTAPGKRNRAAYVGLVSTRSTWRSRLEAANGWAVEEVM